MKIPYKFVFDTFLSIRYDIGSAWEKFEAIRLKDMRHAIGVELAFDTPAGPLKFGLGRSFFLRKVIRGRALIPGPTVFYISFGFESNLRIGN
jgi:hypothetical protein